MTYLNKNAELKNGYNVYIDASRDDYGTMMDVGLLLMEPGDTYTFEEADKEIAVSLFSGKVTFAWSGKTCQAERPDCFRYEAYCLLAGCGTKVTVTAQAHSELYVQKTVNTTPYAAVLYTPETVQTQHAGAKGELMGCMQREIKTFFDFDNAPFSKMVLGEVLSYPGKWSSYPPPPSSPARGVFLPLRPPPGLRRRLCQRRDLQDGAQRHVRHHQRLPLPVHCAGLCRVLYLGHPPSGRGPLDEDPHR